MKKLFLKILFFAFDGFLIFLLIKCAVDAHTIKAAKLKNEAAESSAVCADDMLLSERAAELALAQAASEALERAEEADEADALQLVPYTVSVWLQNVSGKGYKKVSEQRLEGTPGEIATVQSEPITGFTALPVDAETIKADGSTDVMVMYNRVQYTYSFDFANGTAPVFRTGRYGEKLRVESPRKKGYHFSAWNPAVPETFGAVHYNSFTATYVLEGDYGITYELFGGENNAQNPASYNIESADIPLLAPARNGYEFVGWYTDSAFLQPISIIAKGSSGPLTLFACWKARVYTIQLELAATGVKDAESFTPFTVPYAGTYGTLRQPIRNGYVFLGWNTMQDGSGTTVSAKTPVSIDTDHTLYAQWKAKSYKISFNANGGTGDIAPLTASYDSVLTLPENAYMRTGYTFVGWATEKQPTKDGLYTAGEHFAVTKACTLFAIWKPHGYTIQFDANGGKGEMQSLSCTYDAKVQLPASRFEKKGARFVGWSLDKAAPEPTYTDRISVKNLSAEEEVIPLYAVWWRPTVSFNANTGAAAFAQQQVPYGERAALKTAAALSLTREGYHFAGWAKNEKARSPLFTDGAEVTCTEDVMLYAVWEANRYTVRFVAEGFPQSQKTVVFGETYQTLPMPEKHEYTFGGWFTAKNGSGVAITEDTTVRIPQDQTLYAFWHKNPIVTYNANGGSIGGNATQLFGYNTPGALRTAESLVISRTPQEFPAIDDFAIIPCCMFAGWSTKKDGTGTFYLNGETATFSEDVTLYAQWNTYVRAPSAKEARAVTALTRPFYLCTHEVTQSEFEAYCSYGGKRPDSVYGKGANYPVYYVSWYDAVIYCNLRSIAEGLKPVYASNYQTNPAKWDGVIETNGTYRAQELVSKALDSLTADFTADGYRLPTEAEWQYAALGSYVGKAWSGYDESVFAGRDASDTSVHIDDYVWYSANSASHAQPVKTKKPNSYGLYDMSGNVWEWCWDSFCALPVYFTKDYSAQEVSSSVHVLKSGSWSGSAASCSVSRRTNGSAPYRYYYYGFRVARSAPI